MAMTVSPKAVRDSGVKAQVPGAQYEAWVQNTFGPADTYVTGGIPLTPSNFGFNQKIVMIDVVGSQTGGYQFVWNPTTQKLKCFSAAGTELANASAVLQNDVITIHAIGS